jgi:hypothetical protein
VSRGQKWHKRLLECTTALLFLPLELQHTGLHPALHLLPLHRPGLLT